MIRQSKSSHQIKALFIKNMHLQKRQPCTNCCQIFTPIICLVLTILIRNVAIENIPTGNDTIYGVEPLLSFKLNDYSFVDILEDYVSREKAQYYIYSFDNLADRSFIGMHDGRRLNQYSGLLGNISHTYNGYTAYNTSLTNQYLEWRVPPFFQIVNQSITEELFKRYQFLNDDTFYSLRHTNGAQKLPEGAIHFKIANKSRLEATLRVKDVRQFLFYRPNGVTEIRMKIDLNSTHFNSYFTIAEGFLSVMDMISASFIKTTTGKTVVTGYTYLPMSQEGSIFIEMLINTVATIIFPLSLSLLLPVFLYLIVLEKQEKLIQMMRMNGMSMLNYWAINFLYNLLISFMTNLVFYLFGYFFLPNAFFRQIHGGIIAMVFLGWMLSQIGMSMFFQVFLSASRAANIIGYLVAIWTNLIGATLSIALFQYPTQLPMGFRLWPTFSFNRLFYLLFTYCSMDQCPRQFSDVTSEMWSCIFVLYISFVIFSLTGMYLFEIIPQQFGVSQPLLFPLYYFVEKLRKKENSIDTFDSTQNQDSHDTTIDEERSKIISIADLSKYSLVCSGLTKQYPNGKLAVNSLNLVVEDNTIFGLLGPNGAGKTTLLSMITGIFSPSKGVAFVGGYSIRDQIDKVHLEMGVCPQFDILWPTLTVQQHLYFYARLRGINSANEKQKVEDTLLEVNLTSQRNFNVSQLSGGMKRRLSIGISLVGDPRIVFMDEPTTGLDPENRRHLWQVLSKCRQKRSLFLTTHLMEEAEALCDRIGIITKGCIRTVGDQFLLKQIYGKGYYISVSLQLQKQTIESSLVLNREEQDIYQPNHTSIMTERLDQNETIAFKNNEKIQHIKNRMMNIFSPATITKQINGFIKMNVYSTKVSEILQSLRILKEESINFEWSISDSTLEDVFLQVVLRFQTKQVGSLIESIKQQL